MRPVINVVYGNTHCGHDHKTVRAATNCRRLKLRERGKDDNADDPIKLQAFAFNALGRYVKVDGRLVTS